MAKGPKRTPALPALTTQKKVAMARGGPLSHVSFRFGRLDHDGPWPLHTIDDGAHRRLLEKLGHIGRSTFEEISGKAGNKAIPVANLCSKARRRLRTLNLDDYDDVWEMHINGRERIWGLRDGSVMLLLWWDPDHEVCPSAKRNT